MTVAIENSIGGGGSEPEPPAEAIEPGTTIDLTAQTSEWEGSSPASIEDEANPTLTLVDDEMYELGWSEGDGAQHNIEIVDENDDVIDDLETPRVVDPGDDQFLEFEATSEMAEYVCRPHQGMMVGDIEVVSPE